MYWSKPYKLLGNVGENVLAIPGPAHELGMPEKKEEEKKRELARGLERNASTCILLTHVYSSLTGRHSV